MINLTPNSTVCFVGDSITADNRYVTYVLEALKHNGIKVYNCGVSGGTADAQITFFDDNTKRHNPTHIFIMLGVNDSGRDWLKAPDSQKRSDALHDKYELYKKNIEVLYNKALECGAVVTLMTPPPYDEFREVDSPALKGGFKLLCGYADYIREFAKLKECDLVDVHAYICEKIKSETLYNDDRIHLNEKGQFYIAKCILQSLGYDIGEFASLPEHAGKLSEKVRTVRAIYATELMIIGLANYNLSKDEKKEFLNGYLKAEKWRTHPAGELFKNFANHYLEHIDSLEALYGEIDEIINN